VALPQGGAWSSSQNQPPTMTIEREAKATLLQALQGEGSSAKAFQNFMRAEIRSTLWELMKEEVESLCGTSHRPLVDARYRRAGSPTRLSPTRFARTRTAFRRPASTGFLHKKSVPYAKVR
jgi:hypothetical protein